MRILVTGAASPLGRLVVDRLGKEGHAVVGMVRRVGGVKLMETLGAEAALGDPRSLDDVTRAIDHCEMVIHLASYFDFWEPSPGVYESVNIGATRKLVAASIHAGVRRFVLSSSALTIGEATGTIGDEFSKHSGEPRTAFERSKLEAERIALRGKSKGLEIVVVNPGLIVSPRDPGWLGRLFARAVRGERPLVSDAPMGWVWVEDAAQGVVRAALEGANGARYIFSAETLPLASVVQRVAGKVGAARPRAISRRIVVAEAALSTALARPLRRRPRLAMDEGRFLATGFSVDGTFAAHELGLEYTSTSMYLPIVAREYAKLVLR